MFNISISSGTQKHMSMLGIEQFPFTESVLKSAYRQKALQYHPDTNNGDEKMAKMFCMVNEAYEVLQNLAASDVTEAQTKLTRAENIKVKKDIFAVFKPCTACSGRGTRPVRDLVKYSPCPKCGERKCPKCTDGKFTLRSGRVVECLECKGTGVIKPYYHRRHYCPVCGFGGGLVFTYETREVPCSTCNGAGEVEFVPFNPVIPKGAVL